MRQNIIQKSRKGNELTWQYKLRGQRIPTKYRFSLTQLRNDYEYYTEMNDKLFKDSLVEACHFACIVSYYKNLTPHQTVSDIGIVHEIVHYMHHLKSGLGLGEGSDQALKTLRENFKELLKI